MKRRTPVAFALFLAALPPLAAQNEVIKPFRPEGKPAPAKPAEEPPLKPFRPPAPEEPPKAKPVKPKPGEPAPAEPEPPKAKPVPRPPVDPLPPTPPPATKTPKPMTPEAPEPGDIVVKPGVAPTSQDQIQLQFSDGYYSRKMWHEAAGEYQRYLDQFPKAPPADRQAAYYRLAECYRQTDALNNAKANYEAVISNFAGGEFVGFASYRLAELLYAEKDYRAALPIYRRAVARLSQPILISSSKFFIGRCLEATGQKTEAKVTYEDLAKIIEANPYRDASRLSAGRLLIDANQRKEALAWLLPLSEDSPNPQIKTEALALSGQLQLDLGMFDEAQKTIDAALALPDIGARKDALQSSVFRVFYGKKDYKAVIDRYTSGGANGLNIDNRLNVLVVVADSHRELGQRDAALALYEQIGREFPASPQARDALYARLVMLYDAGDARLLDEVNKFLLENPAAPQVERLSLMKAEALFKAGDFANAAPIYKIIAEKSKGLPGVFKGEALFKYGWCLMQLNQLELAVGAFGTFLKDHPTHAKVPAALAQRGEALKQLKRYAEALKEFETLTTKHPQAKEREFGLENLALIQGQIGNQQAMAATFEILLRDFPETAARGKANYWLGKAAFDAKDYKKAMPALEKARELDKEQYFERCSLHILACRYNLDDLDGTEKEIDFYTTNGGKAQVPADVIRWLGRKYFEGATFEKAEKFLSQLVIRKEALAEDILLLARSRTGLAKFKDAVDSFDSYLAMVKEPVAKVAGMIQKTDAQLAMKDWDGAEKTIKDGLTMVTEGRYNGEFRLRGAEIEAGRGNARKALQIFESIPVTLDDEEVCPRALERAAQLARELGDEEKAKKLENQLRSKYPEYLQKKRIAKP